MRKTVVFLLVFWAQILVMPCALASWSTPFALPSCASQVSAIYGVSLARIERRIDEFSGRRPPVSANVMGLSAAALPVLRGAGFNTLLVLNDVCWNIAAGAWILAQSAPSKALEVQVRPAPAKLRPLIDQAAKISGLPAALIQAVADQESRYHVRAMSARKASGLMQMMPSTARAYGVTNPDDPQQNLIGGALYLADLLRQFGGNLPLALAAYNAGPSAVIAAQGIPPIEETQKYVPSVLSRYIAYSQMMR